MSTTKKKKGKTIPLTDFIASERKLVTVRATNWSEIVDSEEAEVKPIVVDIGALPTAPRAAHDIDYSTVPNTPPFIALVANLSFEIDNEGLRRIFADLNPKAARIIRDGIRSKGFGLVEFETRDHLIDALKRSDKELYGRRIRITVSDKGDVHADGGRGSFSNRPPRNNEERPEMADRWKRAEPRPDDGSDDRPGSGFNRERQNRNDYEKSRSGGGGGGQRDNQHGSDYGFGYPRSRDDRGNGGNNRDYNRQGQRNRYQDDGNRSNSGADRPRYSGRYSDTREIHERNRANDETRDDQREPPRERQRLQLQPRTKPLEEAQQLSGSSSSINNPANVGHSSTSNPEDPTLTNKFDQLTQDFSTDENVGDQHDSTDNAFRASTIDEQQTVKSFRGAGASIFGGAKPVDTLARELEIEKKLKELQMTSETPGDNEEKPVSSRPYNRGDREGYRGKRSTNTDDYRDRKDNGRSGHGGDYHHKREYSGGRQYEDDPRKRDDDHPRRGGHDRDRYGGPSRRDHESGRSGKYNHHNPSERNNDRGNFRNRDQDHNEFSSAARPSNNNFNSESQPRNQQRGKARGNIQKEDDSHKLQLSNKFGMLDDDDLDDHDENDEDAQSPNIGE